MKKASERRRLGYKRTNTSLKTTIINKSQQLETTWSVEHDLIAVILQRHAAAGQRENPALGALG